MTGVYLLLAILSTILCAGMFKPGKCVWVRVPQGTLGIKTGMFFHPDVLDPHMQGQGNH
jgi:hypothetical protein